MTIAVDHPPLAAPDVDRRPSTMPLRVAAIATRREGLESWLAVPFGAGMGLTLDESALLLELDDVYWSEEGIVSVQIALVAIAMMSSVALAGRFLKRGEQLVLEPTR